MIAPAHTVVNKSIDDILWTLLQEGYIIAYHLEEKWYKRIKSEKEIRERWQELIDEDTQTILTMTDEEWRGQGGCLS